MFFWNSLAFSMIQRMLAIWFLVPRPFLKPACWEGLGAGGEGDDRGWGACVASPTQWTWVWVNSGSWWWTGRPGVLRFMVSQSRTPLSDFTFTFHFQALEKEMAIHSGVLAWRIPGMGEPGGLPSMGLHRVGHNWSNSAHIYIYIYMLYILICIIYNIWYIYI